MWLCGAFVLPILVSLVLAGSMFAGTRNLVRIGSVIEGVWFTVHRVGVAHVFVAQGVGVWAIVGLA